MRGQFFKKTINDIPIRGKTILLRTDYSLPLDRDGAIENDFNIRMSLATIRRLLDQNCKVVIVSHFGEPGGKVKERFSLGPVAARLATLLNRQVRFVDTCQGEKARMAVKLASPGSVIVLENLRFWPGETQNDPKFAKELVRVSAADYFVQDGFGALHKKHASTDAITMLLPSVAGLLVEKEYRQIMSIMQEPERPVVAVLGGAKVSNKLKIIESVIRVADHVVLGGAMANTFLAYKGVNVQRSKYEPGQETALTGVYAKVAEKLGGLDRVDDFFLLPRDVAVAPTLDHDYPRKEVGIWEVSDGEMILDIGKQSSDMIAELVQKSKTVIWNGPLGMVEAPNYRFASEQLGQKLYDLQDEISTLIGGSDTAHFVTRGDKKGGSFSHVSSGGQASLDLMVGKKLPGLEVLLDAPNQLRYTKKEEA